MVTPDEAARESVESDAFQQNSFELSIDTVLKEGRFYVTFPSPRILERNVRIVLAKYRAHWDIYYDLAGLVFMPVMR